jgi:hypothetical protein
MSYTLNQYVFALQRLLHDSNSQIWPVTPDLVYYINLARDRVSLDTWATRILPVITLTISQDWYLYSQVQQAALNMTAPTSYPSRQIGTIIGINVIQNTSYQPPLNRMSWTELNARYRTGGPTNQAAFPEAWADYGDSKVFYIENAPGTAVTAEIDCKYLPNYLVNLTDTETAIQDPWTELVPLMAARWAMYYQDDLDGAMKFFTHYMAEKTVIAEAMPPISGFSV